MRGRGRRGLCVAALLVTPAQADLRIVTRQTSGSVANISTKYVQGRNWRLDYQNVAGDRYGPHLASIINRELQRGFQLNLDTKQYKVYRLGETGRPLRAPLSRRETRPSGKTLHIYVDTRDTGERQMMFGHLARHVVIRQRWEPEAGSTQSASRTEIDGWYIDLPGADPEGQPRRDGGAVLYAADSHSPLLVDKLDVQRSGKPESGFALRETRTAGDGVTITEVLDLSEAPLNPALFRAPDGFRRVLTFLDEPPPAFGMRLQLLWEWLEDSVQSWWG